MSILLALSDVRIDLLVKPRVNYRFAFKFLFGNKTDLGSRLSTELSENSSVEKSESSPPAFRPPVVSRFNFVFALFFFYISAIAC